MTAPLRAFAEWVMALDDPDVPAGMAARRTVTLTTVVAFAREALAAEDQRIAGYFIAPEDSGIPAVWWEPFPSAPYPLRVLGKWRLDPQYADDRWPVLTGHLPHRSDGDDGAEAGES